MDKEEYKKQGKRNKEKGAEYERLVCKIINDYLGTGFTRTPMSGGMQWKGDIRNDGGPSVMNLIHFECKNHKVYKIQEWLRQTYYDAPSRTIPIVIAKVPRLFKNLASLFGKKVQHVVSLDLLDFLMFIKMIDERKSNGDRCKGEEEDTPGEEEEKMETNSPSQVIYFDGKQTKERADLTRKITDRYSKENRERQEKNVQAAKNYNKRLRMLKKNREKNYKANLQKGKEK